MGRSVRFELPFCASTRTAQSFRPEGVSVFRGNNRDVEEFEHFQGIRFFDFLVVDNDRVDAFLLQQVVQAQAACDRVGIGNIVRLEEYFVRGFAEDLRKDDLVSSVYSYFKA